MDLLKPKQVTIADIDGELRQYTISRVDCVTGREIYAKYILSNLPKVGDYGVSEETMYKLMSFVAVETSDGRQQRLNTPALVKNHVPDWEALQRIEQEMLNYNTSFFSSGRISTFFEDLCQKVMQKFTETLTLSSEPLSPAEKPPSTSSEPSTT